MKSDELLNSSALSRLDVGPNGMDTPIPRDVTDAPYVPGLPRIQDGAVGDLPRGVEARLLEGNWYGAGPEIVLYDVGTHRHVHVPLADRKRLPEAMRTLIGVHRAFRYRGCDW